MWRRDLVDEAQVVAVQDRAVHSLVEALEKLLHHRVELLANVAPSPDREARQLRAEPDPAVRSRRSYEALGSQRGCEPVDGRPGQVHALRELRKAEPIR